ncbi:ATP-binding protein [Phormidium sp. CCY1219]|uniref:ATP-binding protein n=1 Tax=Phormidium sp. CCY1219 TaxID=2886104 RepID=UPI002D1F90B9|nr:4Fe-4S binding protein [Phormidium sp. CCY1219]MEB3829696.1 4Fe-4S binding protein [Phormidium sp. CCY1219]
MKELVIISGKGGTGKTSVVASFAALAPHPVLADCDVDAADLHLILSPSIRHREEFVGGNRASIDPSRCIGCGECETYCRFDAIHPAPDGNTYRVDPLACEGCGVCAHFCPAEAIAFGPAVNGEWYISDTRHGPMIHARLGIAEENSGKLVTLVRNKAKETAETLGLQLMITDGSPGVGCPVMASLTGADAVLLVTEPTPSGLHDLDRVVDLLQRFQLPAMVCINKADLNLELTERIEEYAVKRGLQVVGRIPYTPTVTAAQTARLSVIEYEENEAAVSLRAIWNRVAHTLEAMGDR